MEKIIRWIVVLAIIPVLVHAQTQPITLEDAVHLFEQNSLQRELANLEKLRLQGEAIQYRSFPNPNITVNREQLDMGTPEYDETTYGISMPIELLGQPFLRSRSASKMMNASEFQFEYDRRQLVHQIKSLYAQYWYLSQQLDSYTNALQIIRLARESARERQIAGTYSGIQVQRFTIELLRYQKERDQVAVNLQQAGQQLSTLIFSDQESNRTLEVSDTLTVTPIGISEDILVQYALTHRTDIQAMERLTESAELKLKVEKRDRLPDLSLNLGLKEQSDGAEGLVFGGSIQLPIFNQNRGNVTVARAEHRSRQTALALQKQTVRNEVAQEYRRVQLLLDQWKTLQTDDWSASLLDVAQTAYTEGRYSLLELLDATRAYLDGQSMKYQTIAEYNQALFTLDLLSAGRISNLQTNE